VKKLYLFFICLSLIISAKSQFKFGVQGGLNASKMQATMKMISRTDNVRLGPVAGIMLGADLGDSKFSLLQEFSYITKGLLYNGLQDQYGTAVTIDGNTYINYLEMPLNLLYYSGLGKGHFFFGGGPYVAIGLNGMNKEIYSEKEVAETELVFGNDSGMVKKTDLGFQGLIGYKLGYGSYIKIFYSQGLSNLSNVAQENIKNRNLGICFGYFFGSGRGTKKVPGKK
jgi:hypothetical protein